MFPGVMKATKFSEERLKKWAGPYKIVWHQPKLNGIHLVFDPKSQTLWSPNGLPKFSLPHITSRLISMNLKHPVEGEAYVHGMELSEIVSIVNRKAGNVHPDHEKMEFHIYDVVNRYMFGFRLEELEELRESITVNGAVQIVSTTYLTNHEEYTHETIKDLKDAAKLAVKNNYEGIVVKNSNGLWKSGYSTDIMKIKPTTKEPCIIKEVIEGEGKYKNTMGVLVVETALGVRFHVGSFKLSDEQRAVMWSHKDSLPGESAIVEYTQKHSSGKAASATFIKMGKRQEWEK